MKKYIFPIIIFILFIGRAEATKISAQTTGMVVTDQLSVSGVAINTFGTDSTMSSIVNNAVPTNKAITQFVDSCVVKSRPLKIYGSSGLLAITPKMWTGVITPTTANGQTIDISSAGFSAVIDVQATAANNTATLTSVPFISVKSYTTTTVTLNIAQSNSGLVGILSGLVFATSLTGVTVQVLVIGY